MHSAAPRATLTPLSCSPNFPRAQYLDIRTLTHELIVNYTLYPLHRIPCYTYIHSVSHAPAKPCYTLYSLYPIPSYTLYSLHPIPCTLYPGILCIPCTLCPGMLCIPCTLYPVILPCTLYPGIPCITCTLYPGIFCIPWTLCNGILFNFRYPCCVTR